MPGRQLADAQHGTGEVGGDCHYEQLLSATRQQNEFLGQLVLHSILLAAQQRASETRLQTHHAKSIEQQRQFSGSNERQAASRMYHVTAERSHSICVIGPTFKVNRTAAISTVNKREARPREN